MFASALLLRDRQVICEPVAELALALQGQQALHAREGATMLLRLQEQALRISVEETLEELREYLIKLLPLAFTQLLLRL